MTWAYKITTGELFDKDNSIVSRGYSGAAGACRNNPNCCHTRNVGPIPSGLWEIETCYDDAHRGKHTLRLIPKPETQTFGRTGFLIHGDNPNHTASEGCIILDIGTRKKLCSSPDKELRVIE